MQMQLDCLRPAGLRKCLQSHQFAQKIRADTFACVLSWMLNLSALQPCSL